MGKKKGNKVVTGTLDLESIMVLSNHGVDPRVDLIQLGLGGGGGRQLD